MIKKVLLFILVLFSLFSVGYSSLTANGISYWAQDNSTGNTFDSTGNGNDLTNFGGIIIDGKLDQNYFLNGSSWLNTTLASSEINGDFSLSFWYNNNNTGGQIFSDWGGGGQGRSILVRVSGGNMEVFLGDGTSTIAGNVLAGVTNNIFQFWTITYDLSERNLTLYRNNIQVDNVVQVTPKGTGNLFFKIGTRPNADAEFITGEVDEFGVWNETLNSTSRSLLYNSGTGFNPFIVFDPILTFTDITLNNVTSFNNTIVNDTTPNFDTIVLNISTNGNVNQTYILDGNSPVQFATNNLTGSFTLNLTSLINTIDPDATPSQRLFANDVSAEQYCIQTEGSSFHSYSNSSTGSFTPTAEWDGSAWIPSPTFPYVTSINCVNASVDHTISFFAINNETNVSSGTYNFTIDVTAPIINLTLPGEYNFYNINWTQYINVTDANTVSSCVINFSTSDSTNCSDQNYTFLSNGNITFNITVVDVGGNIATSLNNVVLVNPFNFFMASDGITNLTNFTFGGRADVNGTVTYKTFNDGVGLGINNLSFEKLGYITESFLFLLNSTNQINTTLNVSAAQIVVNLFDRTTGNPLLISTIVNIFTLGNVTTTTGQALFQDFNFLPGEYSVEAVTSGYFTEQQTFTYSGESNATINLFMLQINGSNTETLIVPTVDEWDNILAGVDVRLQEYDASIFGFKQVSQCISNSNGQCQFLVEKSTKSYRLIGTIIINGITYTATNPLLEDDGETFLPIIENGVEVTGIEIIRQLRLKISESLVPTSSIGLLLDVPLTQAETIVGETNTTTIINIPVDFISTNGLSYTVCLEIYVITGNSFTEVISPICEFGESGVLPTSNISLNKDFSYVARVTTQYDGAAKEIYTSYNYQSDKSFAKILEEKALVPNFVMFFWVLLLGLSMYLKNLGLWAWGSFFLAVFQISLFPNLLVASSSVIIIIINIAVLYISKRTLDIQ